MATNLVAPLLLTNSVLAAVPASVQRLRILHISSLAACRSYPGWATYCATKAGAEAFMRCVAQAAARPCTVEIIDPGAMETGMQQAIRCLGQGLPGHDELVQRHERGEIADVDEAARRIFADYFILPTTARP